MARETSKQEWKEVRGKIKSEFGKLSTPQIDALEGNMERLTSTVKKAYSYDQNKAEQVCQNFNKTLK